MRNSVEGSSGSKRVVIINLGEIASQQQVEVQTRLACATQKERFPELQRNVYRQIVRDCFGETIYQWIDNLRTLLRAKGFGQIIVNQDMPTDFPPGIADMLQEVVKSEILAVFAEVPLNFTKWSLQAE